MVAGDIIAAHERLIGNLNAAGLLANKGQDIAGAAF